MSNKVELGERLSFYKLFDDKKYRLLIPIIQRDYAQGRKSKKEVRDNFLSVLYDYLEENKPNRDLDFVYGSLNETNGVSDFIPLDGQQRLTTLFLLHWYLAQISGNMNKFQEVLLKDDKSMFTYETRSSSSEFCDALMGNSINFDGLLDADDGNINALSKTIENSSWFYLSWKHDPTIQSMLTMLDAIHCKFSGKKEYFERLICLENPIITFLFLNLKNFELTDDLYIKMNSRGISLTLFENFKAKFEQYLETIKYDREFKLSYGNCEKTASLKEYFSYNIDTKWTNLFWNYRTNNAFDDELMNFIRVIFTNQYAIKAKIKNKTDDTLEYLLGTNVAKRNKDYSDIISFHKYKELNVLSDESVLYLINALDNLVNGKNKIKIYLSESYQFYFDENTTFEKVLKPDKLTYQDRVIFHAYIRYLIQNQVGDGIEQWMRVIHNLVYNTNIDSAIDFAKAIQSVEELLPFKNNILEYLQTDSHIEFFLREQVSEEQKKACLICDKSSNDWKTQIENIEKHPYFDGQIGFILEFARRGEKYDIGLFSNYANILSKLFGDEYKAEYDCLFQKALLAFGDYLVDISGRKTFCEFKLNLKAKDANWRKLFSDDARKYILKKLLDSIDISNIEGSLQKIIADYPEKTDDWKYLFIKNKGIISSCVNFQIAIEHDKISLARSPATYWKTHAELFSFLCFKKIKSKYDGILLPFRNIGYWDSSYEPCAVIDKWIYKNYDIAIDIYHYENYFLLSFFDRRKSELPEEVVQIIKMFNFEKQENERWHCKLEGKVDFDKIEKIITDLTKELQHHLNDENLPKTD
jgi:hypothetical protein